MKLENKKALYPKTLYQDMIFEGKAVCFANEIVGDFGEAYISNGTPEYDLDKYNPILHDKRYKVTNFQEITIGFLKRLQLSSKTIRTSKEDHCMNIIVRTEEKKDYLLVEKITREAFS